MTVSDTCCETGGPVRREPGKFTLDENAFRAIFDSLQTGIVIIDEESHIIADANPMAVELIGCDKGRIVGNVCHEFICPAKHGQCPITDLGQEVDSAENILITWRGEKIPILKTVKRIEIDGHPYILDSFIDLTMHKAEQDAFHESEETFKQLFEDSPSGLALVDAQGFVRKANQALLKMLGISPEDLVGKNFMELTAAFGLNAGEHQADFNERLTDGNPKTEMTFTRRDGIKTTVSVQSSPIRKEGNITNVLYILTDITERKRTEDALLESERKYRLLSENSSDVIWSIDFNGKYQYVSPSVERLRGFTVDEVMSQNLDQAVMPEDIEFVKKELAVILQTPSQDIEPTGMFELKQSCKDGSSVWAEVSVSILLDEKSTPIGIQGISRNITERRQVETALRESEERFRSIFENTTDGILVSTTNGEFLFNNLTMSEMLGYTPEEMKTLKVMDIHPQKDLPMVMDIFSKIVCNDIKTAHELPMQRKDGSVFYVDVKGNITNLKGETCLVGVFRDITERRTLEATMKANLNDLERYKKATVDREMRMIELKDELSRLRREACNPESA